LALTAPHYDFASRQAYHPQVKRCGDVASTQRLKCVSVEMADGTLIAPVVEATQRVAPSTIPLKSAEPARTSTHDNAPPSWLARLIVFPLLFIPWLILYEWIVYRGPAAGSFETYMPGERRWPIWQWTELLYVSPYLLVTLVPFVANTRKALRQFTLAGLIATVLVCLIFIFVPAYAPPRPFEPSGFLGRMMLWDRWMDRNNGAAAFPSFHVVWAFLGATVFAKRWPRIAPLCWIWATGVSASCVLTGMHSVIDVVAGFLVFVLTYHFAAPIFLVRLSGSRVGSARSRSHGALRRGLSDD
jgi:membrane-associated phospholipid phosphatase